MKQLIAYFISTFVFIVANSQNNFHKLFTQAGQFNYMAMATSLDGSAVMASHSNNGTSTSLSFVKSDSSGNAVWSKTYQPTGVLYSPASMTSTSDGSVVLALLDTLFKNSLQLIKVNSAGNISWSKTFNALVVFPVPPPVYAMPDGSIFFAHYSQDTMYLKKISPDGTLLWQKSYDKPSSSYIIPSAIAYSNGSLYIGGFDNESFTPFLIKTDTLGTILWQKFNVGPPNTLLNLSTTSGGSVILNTLTTLDETKVVSFNPAGNINWSYSFVLSQPRMCKINDNTFGLVSYKNGILKSVLIDTFGNTLGIKSYRDSLSANLFSTSGIANRGYWISSSSSNRIWLMKADINGSSDCKTQTDTASKSAYTLTPSPLFLTAVNTTGTLSNVTFLPQNLTLTDSIVCNSIVPVKLISFVGTFINQKINLSWKITNELNFSRYEIERSADGKEYYTLGSQLAKNLNAYSFVDNSFMPSGSRLFYRLKMINKDGSFAYSNIIKVSLPFRKNAFVIYPNPVKNVALLRFENSMNGKVAIIVADLSGKIVMNKMITMQGKQLPIFTSGLMTGTFILMVDAGGEKFVQKLVISK